MQGKLNRDKMFALFAQGNKGSEHLHFINSSYRRRPMQFEENEVSHQKAAKQYLISEKKFQYLKQFQRDVFESTEFSPSIRKIINELITEENLEHMKTKFVSMCK